MHLRMRRARLVRDDGTVICDACDVADSAWSRSRGLLGRTALAAGEGILLRPASSVHTWFMRFPIDVVYVDRDLRVTKIVERLPPWRVSAARRARGVVELAAGACARTGLAVGERLRLVG